MTNMNIVQISEAYCNGEIGIDTAIAHLDALGYTQQEIQRIVDGWHDWMENYSKG